MAVPGKRRDGHWFGRYELLLKMASGGMATLFLARLEGPEEFEKLFVIKKIHHHLAADQQFIEMFWDEARISALVQHHNVAGVFEFGEEEGDHFLAMEYVHGQTLNDMMRKSKARGQHLPWTAIARIAAEAAAGLHAAHELQGPGGKSLEVVHRDVSPQNILISYDGQVKVVDFGVATAVEKISHTETGTLKGKFAYMSPEQAKGERVDRRSDIFSIGTVLFESLCQRRLFKQEIEDETLQRVVDAKVPRPRSIRGELPKSLEKVVLTALARDREDRYDTAADLQIALEDCLAGEGMVVGQSTLKQLMADYFAEEKKSKESRMRSAMSRDGADPGEAPDWSIKPETSLSKIDSALRRRLSGASTPSRATSPSDATMRASGHDIERGGPPRWREASTVDLKGMPEAEPFADETMLDDSVLVSESVDTDIYGDETFLIPEEQDDPLDHAYTDVVPEERDGITAVTGPAIKVAEEGLWARLRARPAILWGGGIGIVLLALLIVTVALPGKDGKGGNHDDDDPGGGLPTMATPDPMKDSMAGPMPAPVAMATPPPAMNPGMVTIKVIVEPHGAKPLIIWRKQRIEDTTFQAEIPRSQDPESIRITAPGFEAQTVLVIPLYDKTIPVKLMPK